MKDAERLTKVLLQPGIRRDKKGQVIEVENEQIVLIRPELSERKDGRLDRLLGQIDFEAAMIIRRAEDLHPIHGKRILFAIELSDSGLNFEWLKMLDMIRRDNKFFTGSAAAVLVDGSSELYTKEIGRNLALACNLAGASFPGRPLVEGTGSLQNFQVAAKNLGTDLSGAYLSSIKDLIERLISFEAPRSKRPKLLVLHASIRATSNTLNLWNMVKSHLLPYCDIQEINLQNGSINDCAGCHFTTCMHFSKQGLCYYGGVVVDEVYPALEECNALIMLCPNYNDAISANLSASINRMTAIYRRRQFYDKYLYGIIVSGYSGGDIVASQLLSSLAMNKTFILPPAFTMMETANDPGSIRLVPGIEERAYEFAKNMLVQLLPVKN